MKKRTLFLFIVMFLIIAGIASYQPIKAAAFKIVYDLKLSGGLIGYWTFDGENMDLSTNRALDTSGSGNNGTLINFSTSTSPVAGVVGQALDFSRDEDKVVIPAGTGNILDITSNTMSISAWVNAKRFNNSARIVDKTWDNPGQDVSPYVQYALLFDVNQNLRAHVASSTENGGAFVNGATSLSANTWYFATMVYNGSTLKIYLNGVEDGSVNAVGNIASRNTDVIIGYNAGEATQEFDGLIDEVRIYNRALSQEEITYLYKKTGPQTRSETQYVSNKNDVIGYWDFDDCDSCAIATDRSKYHNDGSMFNADSSNNIHAQGYRGNGANFDGLDSGDYVDLGNPTSLQITDAMTVSAWVFIRSYTDSGTIIAKQGGPGSRSWRLTTESTNGFAWQVSLAGTDADDDINIVFSPIPKLNQWTYVAGTYSPSTFGRLYVDGVLVGEDTVNVPASSFIDNGLTYRIGRRPDGCCTFDGFIDDVKIIHRALTSQEIYNEYQSSKNRFIVNAPQNQKLTTGLVGSWSLNGQDTNFSTNQTLDASGNNNTGTLINMSTSTSPVAGVIGQALSFDGANDYVRVPDHASLQPNGGSWTMTAWAKPAVIDQIGEIVAKIDSVTPFSGFDMSICGTWGCDTVGKKLVAGFRDDSGVKRHSISSADVADGQWHLFTAVANQSADHITLYMDGVLLAEGVGEDAGTWPSANNIIPLSIGAQDPNAPGGYFTGSIDEVRLYNRALTQAEITQLYKMGRR